MLLITGGTGFVGTAVTRALMKRKSRLLVRDVKKARALFPRAEIIQGDITNHAAVEQALRGVKAVMHLAGAVSYTLPWEELYKINVEGTKTLLEHSQNVNRIVYASSVGVYGPRKERITETTPLKPATHYGKSKLLAEKEILNSGIPSVVLRIAPIFGTGSDMWIKAIKMFDKGFPIPRTSNLTHLVHVSDVAQAFSRALTTGQGVYNIAGKQPLAVTELCSILITGLGKKPKTMPFWMVRVLVGMAGKGGDFNAFVQHREYDITKARKELGFTPRADIRRELQAMVAWYKETLRTSAK